MTSRSEEKPVRGGVAVGPSGPAAGAVASRAEIRVAGWRWPGGTTLRAPTPEDPFWRERIGESLSLSDVLAGQPAAVRAQALELHRDAIADVIARASEAAQTDRRRARRHVAAAIRLCNELLVR